MKASASLGAAERSTAQIRKPKALRKGARVAVFAPSSPAPNARVEAGMAELRRLGFAVETLQDLKSEGYFAGSEAQRRDQFSRLLADERISALIGLRGGYGSNYLLDGGLADELESEKIILGFSDLSSLQIFLWQQRQWITFYGPMLTAGLDGGAGKPGGYDEESLRHAVARTDAGWSMSLKGETLARGEAQGFVLGGAMTMVEATFGTPWELDTRAAILLLEDRAMKPYQIDRVLMHFKQAGKLDQLKGMVLGDFPDCEPPVAGSPTVRDVCSRILGPLGVPILFGAPVGHTKRPMLTIPLGVQARLVASGEGTLEILEPAVRA